MDFDRVGVFTELSDDTVLLPEGWEPVGAESIEGVLDSDGCAE